MIYAEHIAGAVENNEREMSAASVLRKNFPLFQNIGVKPKRIVGQKGWNFRADSPFAMYPEIEFISRNKTGNPQPPFNELLGSSCHLITIYDSLIDEEYQARVHWPEKSRETDWRDWLLVTHWQPTRLVYWLQVSTFNFSSRVRTHFRQICRYVSHDAYQGINKDTVLPYLLMANRACISQDEFFGNCIQLFPIDNHFAFRVSGSLVKGNYCQFEPGMQLTY